MISPGPRPSSQCSSSSSSRSSETRSHVPKASFKHGLPQQLPPSYFIDISRRTCDIFERASRLKRENSSSFNSSSSRGDGPSSAAPSPPVGSYPYEDVVVCQDMIAACRILEAAPHDFRPDSAASQRPAAKRSGSASSSLDRPPTGRSPVGLTSPLPSARRPQPSSGPVQGRTSDGRFGLNHFPPQRDVHNGPQQAFLESSLATISKPEAWEQWSDARSKFFAECGPLAQEVYTFACIDETIITVSPSSPTLPGSRNSPSTPFRRSPRPDYEAMIAELQSKYVKIGASSYLHMEKAMLVHVWRLGSAANRFVQCWHRCWQVLFEHRIHGIHVPLSTVYDMQGTTISVTALPPVYVDRVPPVRNIFSALLKGQVDIHKRSTKPAVPVVGNPTVDYMLSRFFAALHLPRDEKCLEEFGDCSLYSGVDGRLYLLEIGPILCHTTPVLRAVSTAGPCCPAVRHELLRQYALDHMGRDGSPDELHHYICNVAIPRAIENAVALLPHGTPESRRPEVLLRDSFLAMMFHDHGINVAYMYHALSYCSAQVNRSLPEGGKQQQQQHEDKAPFYNLVIQTALMEMLARTVKGLVRLDLTGGFTTTAERKTSTQVRIDMINRVARLVASRDQEFLTGHVLPALRAKFNTPSDFAMSWDVVPVGAMLKVLSVQFGCEYGVQEGRFHAFTPFATKVALMFYPLVAIDAMLAADEKRTQEGTLQLWLDAGRSVASGPGSCDVSPGALLAMVGTDPRALSIFHLTFLLRALAFTAVTNTHKGKLQGFMDMLDSLSAKAALSPHALTDLLEVFSFYEGRSTEHKRLERLTAYSQLLVDGLLASREPTGSATDDAAPSPEKQDRAINLVARCDVPQLSIRLIHAALQFPSPQTGLLRHAFGEFLQLPHVDFVFSALHSQALREVETRLDAMEEQAVSEFLRSVVEAVVSSLRRWNRLSNAARYLQRLTAAMTTGRRLESVSAAGRVAQLSFSVHSTLFGAHDPRTLYALYVLCIFSLAAFRSTKQPVLHAVHNMHKVLDKHNSLSSALQVSFGRTASVLALLAKVRTVLEELGDTVAVASLKTALHHAQRFTSALELLQVVGRGYLARRSARRGSIVAPVVVPRSLGIVQNLGVSIDNEEDASDCSTLTGSFMGSPVGAVSQSQPRPRFAQKAERPVPLDASIKGKTLVPEGTACMYSPAAKPQQQLQPPAYSQPSAPQSYLYMPPRSHAPPQLPAAQVPANMIARAAEMQNSASTGEPSPGISSASSSTDTPNKAQSSRSRMGVMHDAWGSAPPPPPPPETHVVHLLPSPTSSGGDTSLARSAQAPGQISNATLALFERCDKDHDGVVSVDDCLDVLGRCKGSMSRDELRDILMSCSTKVKQPGAMALLFGRTRDVVPIEAFSKALRRAGIVT